MPHMHRPQTLKQVKKAYRKSGATVRLSESELAIIERRGVLQERADRIKEREARRKANIKRKEERNQRERETKARMGIMEPAKEGITHVGPSQLSMGGFLGPGRKRKGDSEDEKAIDVPRVMTSLTRAEREFWKDQEEKNGHTSIQRTPWRNPLKVISANPTIRDSPPDSSATAGMSLNKDLSQTKLAPPPSSRDSLQTETPIVTISDPMPAAKARRTVSGAPKNCAKDDKHCQITRMAPPPSRKPIPPDLPGQKKPLQEPPQTTKGADNSIQRRLKTEQVGSMAPPPQVPISRHRPIDTDNQQEPTVTARQDKSPDSADECWDDFFVSGTQIARELSPPPIKLPDTRLVSHMPSHPSAPLPTMPKTEPRDPYISNVPPPPLSHATPSLMPKANTAALLDLISTQDLDFSDVLTQAPPRIKNDDNTDDLLAQISTQDLDFSGEPIQAPAKAPSTGSSDFDEDLTEEDLEDVALEFERESTLAKSRTTTPHPPEPPTHRDSKALCWTIEDIHPEHFMDRILESPDSNKFKSEASAFEDSDDGYYEFDFRSSYDKASCKADEEIKQEVKEELNLKPSPSPSFSQDVKVEADYDDFDLSTQDLVDFE